MEIATALLTQISEEEGKAFKAYSDEAKVSLSQHGWPGNVRELQNVVRNAVILNDGEIIEAGDAVDWWRRSIRASETKIGIIDRHRRSTGSRG